VWPAGREAISHLASQPAGKPARHGWVGGRRLAGWLGGRLAQQPHRPAGQLAGWLAGRKIGSWVRAIQFLEMDDPISVPIFRSNILGDTSAAKRSNKLDQEIGSRIGSWF